MMFKMLYQFQINDIPMGFIYKAAMDRYKMMIHIPYLLKNDQNNKYKRYTDNAFIISMLFTTIKEAQSYLSDNMAFPDDNVIKFIRVNPPMEFDTEHELLENAEYTCVKYFNDRFSEKEKEDEDASS